MANEHRKGWFLGISPGEWIEITLILLGAVYAFAAYAGTIAENTAKINAFSAELNQMKTELVSEIQRQDERESKRMDRMENNSQANMRDIRKLLITIKRGQ